MDAMFHKILVAIDQSAMARQVFEKAVSLAQVASAELMLLHVLSHEEDGSPRMPVFSNLDYYPGVMQSQTLELYQHQWRDYERAGLEMLRSHAQLAQEAGLSVEFTQNPGSPSRVICELAGMWKADLIVVGRRGRSGLSELLMGSVSNYVLHHAPCSVLIIHPNSSGPLETPAEPTTEVTL